MSNMELSSQCSQWSMPEIPMEKDNSGHTVNETPRGSRKKT